MGSAAGHDEPRESAGDRGTRDVLLVDDDATLLRILATLFELEDMGVVTVEDGASALARVGEQLPCAVVCDVSMPGLDGLEVCRRLKGDPATREVPVILLTAHGGPNAQAAGEAAGCDGFLTKPFDPLELLTLVQRLGTPRGGAA